MLTPAMARDLQKCVWRYRCTVGSKDWPNGEAIRLRTGRALEKRGFVELGNPYSANRYARWLPTQAGLDSIPDMGMPIVRA